MLEAESSSGSLCGQKDYVKKIPNYTIENRTRDLTTFMCRMSWNLGASTSWNSQGLSRPVKGLL